MKKKLHPLLGSSADPTKVSMTIKSIGGWAVVGVISIASLYGVKLEQNVLLEIVNSVAFIASSFMTLYGLLRKVYFALYEN